MKLIKPWKFTRPAPPFRRDPCATGPDWLRPLLAGGLAVICAAVFSGCASTDRPASANFASVVIPGRSVEQIQTTAVAVFQGAGYQALRKPDGSMVFEKESSRNSQLAYSGLGGTHYGEQVNVRVRAEVVDLGAGSHRLQCKAWTVRHAGDSFFEEEVALTNFRRGSYQKLLDEVASRLK